MMKKSKTILYSIAVSLTVLLLCAAPAFAAGPNDWTAFQNGGDNNGVTSSHIPENAAEANHRWSITLEDGEAKISPAIAVDGVLFVASGKHVYRLDRDTGEILETSGELTASAAHAMFPPTYSAEENMLYLALAGGVIQAVDAETLAPLWHTESDRQAQGICPVIYHRTAERGMVFSGTFRAYDGAYYAVDAETGQVLWTFRPKEQDPAPGNTPGRDFYWAGSFVNDQCVYVGSDTPNGSDVSTFYALDVETGQVRDKIENVAGSIRSTAVHSNGRLYFASQGGELYRVSLNADGTFEETAKLSLGGAVTTTPVINGNRLYIGVGKSGSVSAHYSVVNTETMQEIYRQTVGGYPQGSPAAYVNDDGDAVIAYTYNDPTSGLYVFSDQSGQSQPSGIATLHQPADPEFCISQLCVDEEGTIYFVNDSHHLMAVERKVAFLGSVDFRQLDQDGQDAGAVQWENGSFSSNKRNYSLLLANDAVSISVESLRYPEGAVLEIRSDGTAFSEGDTIPLRADGSAEVTVTVKKGDQEKAYRFRLKGTRDVSGLRDLRLTTSHDYTDKGDSLLTPAFAEDVFSYRAEELDGTEGPFYIWAVSKVPGERLAFVAVKNVKGYDPGEEIIDYEDAQDGSVCLRVDPADAMADVTIRLQSISANGENVSVYDVTLGFGKGDSGGEMPSDDGSAKKKTDLAKLYTPGTVTLTKAKKGKKKITVQWKRLGKNVKGYQILLTPAKGGKTVRVTVPQGKKKTLKKVIKKLKRTKYTVKIRAYNKVGGKTYWGKWSAAKKVKVK